MPAQGYTSCKTVLTSYLSDIDHLKQVSVVSRAIVTSVLYVNATFKRRSCSDCSFALRFSQFNRRVISGIYELHANLRPSLVSRYHFAGRRCICEAVLITT